MRLSSSSWRVGVIRFAWWPALLAAMLLLLAGCQAAGSAPQPGPSTPLPNPPAVTEPATTTPAQSPPLETVPTKPTSPAEGDPSSWPAVTRTVAGITYSFRYPPGWTSDLSYCAPGKGGAGASGPQVPAGCAVTDILVGQKAVQTGRLAGDALTLNGMSALRAVDTHPKSGLASRIYTVMVYGAGDTPLFGFSTSIGPGTDEATQVAITAALDRIASTITVEGAK